MDVYPTKNRFGDPILRTCGKVAPVAGSWRMRLHHLGPDIFVELENPMKLKSGDL